MRHRRDAVLALFAAAFVILSLLAVFAIELSDTQAKSKQDVKTRVHERAVLAAALIDSLFNTVNQQLPQDSKIFGSSTVSARAMDRQRQTNSYLVLLDASGTVIAHSRGFTDQARANLASSAALALVRAGHAYGLGDLQPYGSTGVVDFAVSFPTRSGLRTLLTGFAPGTLGPFITGELRRIPGVRGAQNFLVDGGDAVLASTSPAIAIGYRFSRPDQLQALSRGSADAGGYYYDQVHLANSTWRVVLSAPDGPLFASVTGLRKWLPWAIFIAFAVVALIAIVLGRRVFSSADRVRQTNAQLAVVNDELAHTNAALAHRALELARSNAELEQFASIASHDLQEPLRKVRTFTQQLEVTEAERLSDKGHDYLRRANGAAERMQKLIEDLLKFSRVATHARPFAPVDLTQVTREVLDDLAAQVEATGAAIHLGKLPTINADALQMRQLMQNLISNALKFSREGVAPEARIEAQVRSREICLTVSDNGIGFDPVYSRRIFRVFERLNGRGEYPGTGIGLALCRKIVERHGGAIEADSVPGAGSTFMVTLPRHAAGETTPAPLPEPERDYAHA